MPGQLANFFGESIPTQAYLKMGIMGGPGAGKTYTSALVAIGLHKLLARRGLKEGSTPVAFLETSEFGVGWVKPLFDEAGIQLAVRKTRRFADFVDGMHAAAIHGMILITDSVTGFWTEIVEAYKAELGRINLSMEEWAPLKAQWGEAMEVFKNTPAHIILSGRAGYEYERHENEATGRMELERTGIRMKAEGETTYEPSLVVYMRHQTDMSNPSTPRIYPVATVMKDRGQALQGQSFPNPTFDTFRPHIELLALGGRHVGVGAETSREMVLDPRSGRTWAMERDCVVDEIESLLTAKAGGQSQGDKEKRANLLLAHFGTFSKERIKTLPVDVLRRGFGSLHMELMGVAPTVPGRPTQAPIPAADDPMAPLADHFGGNGAAATAAPLPVPTGPARPGPALTEKELADSEAEFNARKAREAAEAAGDQSPAVTRPPADPAPAEAPAPKRRGRPRKTDTPATSADLPSVQALSMPQAPLPADEPVAAPVAPAPAAEAAAAPAAPAPKRGPGRPRKNPAPVAAETPAAPAVASNGELAALGRENPAAAAVVNAVAALPVEAPAPLALTPSAPNTLPHSAEAAGTAGGGDTVAPRRRGRPKGTTKAAMEARKAAEVTPAADTASTAPAAPAADVSGSAPADGPAPATNTAEADKEARADATFAAATEPVAPPAPKRGPGRPRKNPVPAPDVKPEAPAVTRPPADPAPAAPAVAPAVAASTVAPAAAVAPKVVSDPNKPDVGTWTGFMAEAARVARDKGIPAEKFGRGVTETLRRSKLAAVDRSAIPREYLLDWFDAIESGNWNPTTGEFSAPEAATV
jgi:hypothetical protein